MVMEPPVGGPRDATLPQPIALVAFLDLQAAALLGWIASGPIRLASAGGAPWKSWLVIGLVSGACALFLAAVGLLFLRNWARWLHVTTALLGHVALLAAWPDLLHRSELGSRFGPYGWVLAAMACAACGLAASLVTVEYLLRPTTRDVFSRRHPARDVTRAHPLATASVFVTFLIAFLFAVNYDPPTEAARGLKIESVEQLHDAGRLLMRHRENRGAYPRDEAEALEAGVPAEDPWGRPLRYAAWSEDSSPGTPDAYVLASAGSDGAWESQEPRDLLRLPGGNFPRGGTDVVLHDGALVRYPFLGG